MSGYQKYFMHAWLPGQLVLHNRPSQQTGCKILSQIWPPDGWESWILAVVNSSWHWHGFYTWRHHTYLLTDLTHFVTWSRAPKLLFLFFAEFGILKWNFHVLFPVYFNVNYWNKVEFYVKFAIFSILKWKFQNINGIIVGLYKCIPLQQIRHISLVMNQASNTIDNWLVWANWWLIDYRSQAYNLS